MNPRWKQFTDEIYFQRKKRQLGVRCRGRRRRHRRGQFRQGDAAAPPLVEDGRTREGGPPGVPPERPQQWCHPRWDILQAGIAQGEAVRRGSSVVLQVRSIVQGTICMKTPPM